MRWSQEQLDAHLNMHQMKKNEGKQSEKQQGGARALGRLKQGVMNNTERKYADHLESRKVTGEILYYAFDSLKFRLADKTFYTPDFVVMKASGEIEIHEVKGHWEDDARVKIKVAASMHPFPFIAVMWDSQYNDWKYENF